FALTGRHKEALCESCHRPANLGGMQTVAYVGLTAQCSGCHADVHGGQFTKPSAATECSDCHNTQSFKPADFRHRPPFTSFLLEGKHASTACKSCHPAVRVGGGATVQRYRHVPTTCIGCHADVHGQRFQGFVP